jgi:hypothetical protein
LTACWQEHEVAVLPASALTNRQIAARLPSRTAWSGGTYTASCASTADTDDAGAPRSAVNRLMPYSAVLR